MRVSATAEQIEYLAELGVPVLPTTPAKAAVAQAPIPVAVACPPPPATQAVFVPVAIPAPQPSWWTKNTWWITLMGSAVVLLLKLILFLLMKG